MHTSVFGKTVPCCTLDVGHKESFIYQDLSLSEFINCSWIHYWQRILKPTVKYCFNKGITWETDEWDPFEIEDYGLFYLLPFGTNGEKYSREHVWCSIFKFDFSGALEKPYKSNACYLPKSKN